MVLDFGALLICGQMQCIVWGLVISHKQGKAGTNGARGLTGVPTQYYNFSVPCSNNGSLIYRNIKKKPIWPIEITFIVINIVSLYWKKILWSGEYCSYRIFWTTVCARCIVCGGNFKVESFCLCSIHQECSPQGKFQIKVHFFVCLQAVYHQSAKYLWSNCKTLGLLLYRSEVRSKTCKHHFPQCFWNTTGQTRQIPPHQCLHHLHSSSLLWIHYYQNHCLEQHVFHIESYRYQLKVLVVSDCDSSWFFIKH